MKVEAKPQIEANTKRQKKSHSSPTLVTTATTASDKDKTISLPERKNEEVEKMDQAHASKSAKKKKVSILLITLICSH